MGPIGEPKIGGKATITGVITMRWGWLTTALKRLASAVRFRPWPPCFQALTSAQNLNRVPKRSNNLANGGRNLPRCTPTALPRSLQSNNSKFIYGEDTNGRHKKSSWRG